MTKKDIRELGDRLNSLGPIQEIYNFLNSEGCLVQSPAVFSNHFRDREFKRFREDLVHHYIPEESCKKRILRKLRKS